MDCQEDLLARLQSIAVFGSDKVKIGSSPEEISSYFKGVTPPVCGLIYEGMRAQSEGASRTPQGLSTVVSLSCYLMVSTPLVINSKATQYDSAMGLLDLMRSKVLGKRAVTGHPWKFVVESFVDSSKGQTLWVQKWETTVINEIVEG